MRMGGREQAQWWLGLAAALATAAFAWLLLAPGSTMPAPSLPAYDCPGKTLTYDSSTVRAKYREHGCGAIKSGGVAVDAVERMRAHNEALMALRLPPVPTDLQVGFYGELKGAPVQVFGTPPGPRAVAIELTREQVDLDDMFNVDLATTELALSEGAPGLDDAGLKRLGRAYAVLISGRADMASGAERELAAIRRHGVDFIPELLNDNCRISCIWEQVLSRAERGIS